MEERSQFSIRLQLGREEVPDLAKLARGIGNDNFAKLPRGIGGNFEKLARGIENLWRVFEKLPKKVPYAEKKIFVSFLPL